MCAPLFLANWQVRKQDRIESKKKVVSKVKLHMLLIRLA